jgi:hypothetical protein
MGQHHVEKNGSIRDENQQLPTKALDEVVGGYIWLISAALGNYRNYCSAFDCSEQT